jgi:hypothetical protein
LLVGYLPVGFLAVGVLLVGFLPVGFLLVGLEGLTGFFDVVRPSGGAPFASAGENTFGKPAMIDNPAMPEVPRRILRRLKRFIIMTPCNATRYSAQNKHAVSSIRKTRNNCGLFLIADRSGFRLQSSFKNFGDSVG